MTRIDFIDGLRDGLNGEVPARVVQESVEYYNRYINESIAEGKTEQQVLEELGPVRLIVKSIIDANSNAGRREEAQSQQNTQRQSKEKKEKPRFHTGVNEKGQLDLKFGNFSFNSWYGKLLLILLAILVVAIIVALAVGLLMVAWYLLPVIAVIILIVVLVNIFIRRNNS
ncbi:MAG: hypothetical protein J6B50_09610 [Lachnospiraceae bacterium]|nr:hypothetical protein [Lachnospiraceae bacterium]MBP3507852.1 hypothetical protein [Lachnospiraceae bacterium]